MYLSAIVVYEIYHFSVFYNQKKNHNILKNRKFVVKSESVICLVLSDSLRLHGLQPTRLLCPWDFPGKNTGVGCDFLLQGIFPTQRLNLLLLNRQLGSLLLSHQGSLHDVRQRSNFFFSYLYAYLKKKKIKVPLFPIVLS